MYPLVNSIYSQEGNYFWIEVLTRSQRLTHKHPKEIQYHFGVRQCIALYFYHMFQTDVEIINNKTIGHNLEWTHQAYILINNYQRLIHPQYVDVSIWVIINCDIFNQRHNIGIILIIVRVYFKLHIKSDQLNKTYINHASIGMII